MGVQNRTYPTWFQSEMFPKDFHVSPFSSRKGSYTVSTRNPHQSEPSVCVDRIDKVQDCIDIRVTLYSSKGHAKLYARAWCDIAHWFDPEEMSTWGLLKIMTLWLSLGRLTCTYLAFTPSTLISIQQPCLSASAQISASSWKLSNSPGFATFKCGIGPSPLAPQFHEELPMLRGNLPPH